MSAHLKAFKLPLGRRGFPGPCDLGHNATSGNCWAEAFAVGWHKWLITDRKCGVAVWRDSIADGNGVEVDADIHFDPVPAPSGQHGRVFHQAVVHIRAKMAALVMTREWWAAERETARACFQVADMPQGEILDRIMTDKELGGELETVLLTNAFRCQIITHTHSKASRISTREHWGQRRPHRSPHLQRRREPLLFGGGRGHGRASRCAAGYTKRAGESVGVLDDVHPSGDASIAGQLQLEMAGLMSAILTSQKGSNESQSQRLIPLGDGRHAHARTSLEKVWARSVEIRNERGGNAALFKDHLTKVAQNSATTADIRTVAISSNGVDCSNDALSLFADLAVSFRDADDALLTLYIGQCDRLLERKRLLDASISFDSIPDVLAFRCTWYMRHTTLRDDGATKCTPTVQTNARP